VNIVLNIKKSVLIFCLSIFSYGSVSAFDVYSCAKYTSDVLGAVMLACIISGKYPWYDYGTKKYLPQYFLSQKNHGLAMSFRERVGFFGGPFLFFLFISFWLSRKS